MFIRINPKNTYSTLDVPAKRYASIFVHLVLPERLQLDKNASSTNIIRVGSV